MNGYALFARYGMDDILLCLYEPHDTNCHTAIAEAERLYATPAQVAACYKTQADVFGVELSVLLNTAVSFSVMRFEDGRPVEQVFQTNTNWERT